MKMDGQLLHERPTTDLLKCDIEQKGQDKIQHL